MENLYDNTNVIELCDNDVEDYRVIHPKCNNNYGMVVFYAPWCPHCTTLVKPMDFLAKKLNGRGVSFGAVNCTKQPGLSQSFKIRDLPSLYTLYPGGKLDKYEGNRNIDDLLHWMVKITNGKNNLAKNNVQKPIDLDDFTDSEGDSVSDDDSSVDISEIRKSIEKEILHDDRKEADKPIGFMDKLNKLLEPPPQDPNVDSDLYQSSIEKTDSIIVGSDAIDIGDCGSKNSIIIAYMPWCGHCKTMVDVVSELVRNGSCVFTINCQKQLELTKMFKIDSFPTILYRKGLGYEKGPTKIADLQKYNGPRSLEALTTLLKTGDASQIGGAFLCPAISWQLCSIM